MFSQNFIKIGCIVVLSLTTPDCVIGVYFVISLFRLLQSYTCAELVILNSTTFILARWNLRVFDRKYLRNSWHWYEWDFYKAKKIHSDLLRLRIFVLRIFPTEQSFYHSFTLTSAIKMMYSKLSKYILFSIQSCQNVKFVNFIFTLTRTQLIKS